jgi:hypothetical protein
MKTTITKSRSGHYTVTIRAQYDGVEFTLYKRGKLSSLFNAQRVAGAIKRDLVLPGATLLADPNYRQRAYLAADRIAKEVM